MGRREAGTRGLPVQRLDARLVATGLLERQRQAVLADGLLLCAEVVLGAQLDGVLKAAHRLVGKATLHHELASDKVEAHVIGAKATIRLDRGPEVR